MAAMDYAKVAHLYDLYADVDFDIPFFRRRAQKAEGPVLELMSGTGRVSIPLIEAGVPLTCVDASPEMLEILRRKLRERGLSAEVHEADVTRLALGKRYDLIFIAFHSFSEITDAPAQLATLRAIRAHLGAGGRFICTLHNPAHRIRSEDGRLRLLTEAPAGDGRTLLLWGVGTYDAASRIVTGKQIYEIYGRDGVMRSRRMLDVRFAVPSREGFEGLARQAGLRVEAVYGDYRGHIFDAQSSPFLIFDLAAAPGRR